MEKPSLKFWQLWNISFGFFGIQIAFALQNANVSRIFQTLGVPIEALPLLWLAGPVTGLLVQPLVGHFSDRTWGPLGRRRPYFLAGAILTTGALVVLPNSPLLWVAAAMLWILDAAINVSMEPFRAFVGDMTPARQRTQGFAMQTIFIGTGAFLASFAPTVLTAMGVSNTAEPGMIPNSVKLSFYIGAAAVLLAILWTVLRSREYSPEELARFKEPPSLFRGELDLDDPPPPANRFFAVWGAILAALGLGLSAAVLVARAEPQLYVLTLGVALAGVMALARSRLRSSRGREAGFFVHIMDDFTTMPAVMRRLAVVQFCSWFALFIMWVYATPAVTSHLYGATDPTSAAYNDGANWVGQLFAWYNGFAALYAFALPWVSRALGKRGAHALGLTAGAIGLASFYFTPDPKLLVISMVLVGVAWASILTMPYAILSDALPARKMGVYMGIFNFFIVIPQIVVGGLMGPVLKHFLGNQPIFAFLFAGAAFGVGAIALSAVKAQKPALLAKPAA